MEDPDLGPVPGDVAHDPTELLGGPGTGIDVGWPDPGAQQVVAAEDVERQVAVVVVVTVEESLLLLAEKRVVRKKHTFGRTADSSSPRARVCVSCP